MKKLVIMLLMILSVGCSKKYVTAPQEPVKSEETAVHVTSDSQKEIVEDISAADVEGLYAFNDVLFDFDKYDIRKDARAELDAAAAYLKGKKGTQAVIEGHCDERGTNEYNLALGEKRAKAARDYLAAQGINRNRMSIITYGEERPACTDQNETCYQKNRRARIRILEEK